MGAQVRLVRRVLEVPGDPGLGGGQGTLDPRGLLDVRVMCRTGHGSLWVMESGQTAGVSRTLLR